MTDYTELVKALRYCEFGWSTRTCDNCEYSKTDCQLLLSDAADAIEALQDTVQAQDKALKECARQLAKMGPKRGEWKITTERFTPELICSECGVHIPCVAGWCMDAHMNYCPNCGAKMEVQDDS